MPGTKIINVLRDDKLNDILDIFRKTLAEEVIFVLPKNSKAFSNEKSFAMLAEESSELGKAVLILSESPKIKQFAANYNLAVLTNEKDENGSEEMDLNTQTGGLDQESDYEDDSEQTETAADELSLSQNQDEAEGSSSYVEDDNYQPAVVGEESEATLATASKAPQSMEDIIQPETKKPVSLKVNQGNESPMDVEVKKKFSKKPYAQTPAEKAASDELRNVWLASPKLSANLNESKNVQTQIKREIPKIYDGPAPGLKLPGFPIGRWASKLSKKTLYLYGLAVIVIFGFVVYVSMGKADVVVKATAYPFDSSFRVAASDSFLSVDPDLKRIPGQLFTVDKKIDESFSATGEKDVVQKSKGIITVYNEYGTTPQILIATTRFEGSDGLIFRTLKTITVPGTRVENGKITPGTVNVEVIADKAGDAYNVAPGKFTIPGFKEKGDNDRYQKFYGQSSDSMKGGIIGKAKVVTEQDYNSAKTKIEQKVASEVEAELKNQAGDLKIISLPKVEVKNTTSSAQIDEAVDTFTMSGTANVSMVGFKNSDLDYLITKYAQNLNDVEVLPDRLDIKFSDVGFDSNRKILEFTLSVKGSVYGRVNKEKIISDLIGRGEENIKDYFNNIKGVTSAHVTLSPFWVMRVPSDKSRINLKIDY